jgi:Putative peptidoglycan binding domain/L,D-transpeptidase catalytic domain
VRRAFALGAVGVALSAGSASGATLTLRVEPGSARYGSTIAFAGELTPAQANVTVGVYRRAGSQGILVGSAPTGPDGAFRLAAQAREPGSYFALAQPDPATQAVSPEAGLRVRPILEARLSGRRRVGERLVLSGRLLPAAAGRLAVRLGTAQRRLRVSSAGRFRFVFPARVPGRFGAVLSLTPAAGYERVRVKRSGLIRAPRLGLRSEGNAVRALEARLRTLHYALRGVNGYYGWDTYEAVLAFQKVHGMTRTGRVDGAVWRRLARAHVPNAHVPRGNHLEVSKSRQIVFEVRGGKVVNVIHASTGATGNTPVGRWRVYRLGPGGSLSHMYYSMYFLRGFAIHGYHSVPPWPASHGCVRIPLWQAPGLYGRWGRVGTAIYVFP